jgi:inner membrane protein
VDLLLYKTHLLGGFLAGFILTGSLACGAVSAAAALLPDLDAPKSFIGSVLSPVSHVVGKEFGHRHAFHSMLAALLFEGLGLLARRYFHWPPWVPEAVFIGYASHLLLDTLNPSGIPWLWPLKFRFRIPLFQTGGFLERFVLAPVELIVAVLLVGMHAMPIIGHVERSFRPYY